MSLLLDPKIFNYLIMLLYGLNIIRWLAHGSYVDAMYWTGALWISATVTFGYDR